jgi:hypothetical protein
MPPSVEAVRVARAAEHAMARLERVCRHVIDTVVGNQDATDAVHAPLGETIMWLSALDEIVADHMGKTYERRRNTDPEGLAAWGLKVVRNSVAHGGLPVQVAASGAGAMLGRAVLPFQLGVGATRRWLPSSVLNTKARVTEREPHTILTSRGET